MDRHEQSRNARRQAEQIITHEAETVPLSQTLISGVVEVQKVVRDDVPSRDPDQRRDIKGDAMEHRENHDAALAKLLDMLPADQQDRLEQYEERLAEVRGIATAPWDWPTTGNRTRRRG